MSSITKAFQENLRSIRELRGLTQSELGVRAGMAAASVSHFETGQRAPSLDSLVKLADALSVPVDTLLGRSSIEEGAVLDPVFRAASRADAQMLDTVRRVTAALLAAKEASN